MGVVAAAGAIDWNWDDLRYFLRAARARTLSGAARALRVEHTTIGRRLAALERSLGAPLVLRKPDGLRLTPLGAELVPLVDAVEKAVLAVQARVQAQASLVRLAVPSGFTRLFTAKLPMLRREHPELALELVSGARPVDLERGEADLAIRIGPVADPELVARKVGDVGWSVYASPAYLKGRPRVDLDDLRGHDVIGYDASLAGMPAARWLEARAGRARVALRSREMTDMLAAAVNGAGIAVLPCVLGDAEPLLQRLTPDVVASRPAALVHRREATIADSVRAVKRFVVVVMHEASRALLGR